MLVFVGYARADLKFVLALTGSLKKYQVPVWMEQVDVPLGVNRDIAIETTIKQATHFLLVMSNSSVHSENIIKQLNLALAAQKQIVPIKIDECVVPSHIKQLEWTDFRLSQFNFGIALRQLLTHMPHIPYGTDATPVHLNSVNDFTLADSFEWITIPAGQVELDGQGKVELDTFQISKYPLTNAQYAKFVEAGGYHDQQWWTDDGWETCKQGLDFDAQTASWKSTSGGWIQPRFWHDTFRNGAAHAVVGVSWFEALAFCKWASAMTGYKILLPTEMQWQRAAQGDDGRRYPWGNDLKARSGCS
jgi:formylglycine-generating enzyme required for sulfatase activity